MTRRTRIALAVALATGAATGLAVAPSPAQAAGPPAACIDLSPLGLPSICLGSLLGG